MNRKKIEEIVELMEKYGLSEIDVEEEGCKIHIKKGAGGVSVTPAVVPQPVMHQALPAAQAAAAVPESKQESKGYIEIKAPMVGTFYRAPSPDAEPYVDAGDVIKEGDILCIIEAMKLMNEIKAEVKGKIVNVMVENGQPVEFGQVIFQIEQG